jgi:hypothetical protein
LMRHLGEGKTRAFIKVDSALPDVDSTVLGGVIQGSRWPDERVAVIGHRDTGYPPGANDNGSSLGCILEIARSLASAVPCGPLNSYAASPKRACHLGPCSMSSAVRIALRT